ALGDRLATLVSRQNHRIGTGFVGTPIILDALTTTGHLEVATALLLEPGCPSWLYPVTMGATTVWERWDSMRPDGTVNTGTMTSFNHYAFGAVADWLHRTVAGLAPQAAGYREIRISPQPISGLEHASARLDTPYGRAESGWRRRDDDSLTVYAVVPPNTEAHVRLPGAAADLRVGSGSHQWTVPIPSRG
ncbi:MAG TPA: alpha-L-rhamnosidase C-terminal domain-containing protein, partial [Micromonospora sp.]